MFSKRPKATLDHNERQTILSALGLAAEQYDKNAGEFVKLAKYIRAGNTYPMFAEGEPGARAADRLAQQFVQQAADARELHERIETFDSIMLVGEES